VEHAVACMDRYDTTCSQCAQCLVYRESNHTHTYIYTCIAYNTPTPNHRCINYN